MKKEYDFSKGIRGKFYNAQGEFNAPDSQRPFSTEEAETSLETFNEWESKKPAKGTDCESLFLSLKKRKQLRGAQRSKK